MLPMEISF